MADGPPTLPRTGQNTAQEWLSASIEPVRPSLLYVVGLAVVAAALIVLALAYVGIIVAAGYVVYIYATDVGLRLFDKRVSLWRLFLYVTPVVSGFTLVVFLIKPLFARQVKAINPYDLQREQEPGLYAFVERVAFAVGAPPPREIMVTCDVNAAAGFRRGFLSMFGNDLRLVIGMPLAAGLDARQFAGVLAHELGHFAQGAGMRLNYLIRSINSWFARVVYERDAWDHKLIELSNMNPAIVQIVFLLARLAVWLTRVVLWFFMMISHALSNFMLRQMEFDADRYEARLAGSECFVATTQRMAELSAAAGYVYAQVPEAHAARRLADDLPALIVAAAAHIPAEVRKRLDEDHRSARTRFFDTHPCMRARVASVMAEKAPGIYVTPNPAARLFRNFPVLCKWTTIGQYEAMLGRSIRPDELVSASGIATEHRIDENAGRAARRFYQGLLVSWRPLFPERFSGDRQRSSRENLRELRLARQRFERALPAAREAFQKLQTLEKRKDQLHAARTILSLGVKPNIQGLALPHNTQEKLRQSADYTEKECEQAAAIVKVAHEALRDRLSLAIALLDCPQIAAKLNGAKLRAHVQRFEPALAALQDCLPELMALRDQVSSLVTLISTAIPDAEKAAARVQNLAHDMHISLTRMRGLLRDSPAPFTEPSERVSLATFAIELVPNRGDLPQVIQCASGAVERLFSIYLRMMGRMGLIAEKVEHAVGLLPLPEPAESSSQSVKATAAIQ